MKKYTFLFFVLATALCAVVATNTNTNKDMKENVKLLTTEQLWKSLEKAQKNRLPKTAKPYIEELKERFTKAKDTNGYFRLCETENIIRQQCYSEYDDKKYTADEWREKNIEEARSLWLPVKEMLLSCWYDKEKTDVSLNEILIDNEDELTAIKQNNIYCDQLLCIPNASLYDGIVINLLQKTKGDTTVLNLWKAHVDKYDDDISANLHTLYKFMLDSRSVNSKDDIQIDYAAMKSRAKTQTSELLAAYAQGVTLLNEAIATECETAQQVQEVKNKVADVVAILIPVAKAYSIVGQFAYDASSLIESVESSSATLSMPKVVNKTETLDPREKKVSVTLTYKNYSDIDIAIYRAKNVIASIEKNKSLAKYTPIKSWKNFPLEKIGNPLSPLFVDATLTLDEVLPSDEYVIVLSKNDKLISHKTFFMSQLSVFGHVAKKGRYTMVSDAHTGAPRPDVKVGRNKTDVNGMVVIPYSQNEDIAEENGTLSWELRGYYYEQEPKDEDYYTAVTDRPIYRPSQTVHFKGWSYKALNGDMESNVAMKVPVVFATSDGKKVKLGDFVTNAWGSFSGEFAIPENAYCGMASLCVDDEPIVGFQIEEYKRTNIELSFKPIQGIVKKGETVSVNGSVKQANGNPVTNATVQWNIGDEKRGTSITDNDGEFTIVVDSIDYGNTWIYAKVTDLKGETTESSKRITCNIEGSSMDWLVNEKYVLQGEDVKFTVNLGNLNGAEWTSDVTYSIFKLRRVDGKIDDTEYVVEKKESMTGRKTVTYSSETLEPGAYKIRVSTNLADGSLCERDDILYVVPKADQKIDVFSEAWVEAKSQAVLGESLNVRVATELDAATAYIFLFADSELLSVQNVALSSEVKTISVPMPTKLPKEASVKLKVDIVGHNLILQREKTISLEEGKVVYPLILKTQRDISAPGAHEKWTIQLGDSINKAPLSEIVATMFDERLTELSDVDEDWEDISFEENRYSSSIGSFMASPITQYNCYRYYYVRGVDRSRLTPDMFPAILEYAINNRRGIKVRGIASVLAGIVPGIMPKSAMKTQCLNVADDEELSEDEAVPVVMSYGKSTALMPSPSPEENIESLKNYTRDNFAETVFFYPHLETDENGIAQFEFDLPDNLTTYLFYAIAHTKDMQKSYLDHELAVRKELTVTMGAPRFAVEGDNITLTALVECYDKSLSTIDCQLQVKDATGKVYLSESQNVDLNGSSSAQTSWQISIPEGVEELTLSVSAKGDRHQDTEVTTMQVTKRCVETYESLPFVVIGKNYKNDFHEDAERIKRQKKYGNGNLTFKYNSNAFVEVVDALPYLGEEWAKTADTYLGRVETSAITNLIKSRPDVQKAISGSYKLPRLNDEGYDTPWHNVASHMTNHTADINDLLSGDKADSILSSSLCKLRELQKSDGSIMWCPGMAGSDYMTMAVAEMLGRMVQMNLVSGSDKNVVELCDGLKRSLDKMISEEAKEAKEEKAESANSWIVDLLYARSLMPGKWSSKADYLVDLVKKSAQKDLSESYRISVAALYAQIGAKAECEMIVRSLIENLQHPKKGLASVYVRSFFYPTYTEIRSQSILAILLGRMEAMGWNSQNDNLIETRDQLINWLIFQKRSSYWRDRQSTSMAVLAIMGANAEMTSTDEVKIGTDSYTCSIVEPQLQMPRTKIETVAISKSQGYPSWGAWQWTETTPQDELIATGCEELKVARTIYVQRNGEFEKLEGKLKVGDIVKVELTLKTTADMSFVHLREHKAASFEHKDQTSGYIYPLWWRANRSVVPHYYQPHDTHIDFFIEHLRKGESTLSYEATVTNAGDIVAGFAEVQCIFTPELVAKSAGSRIVISNINK